MTDVVQAGEVPAKKEKVVKVPKEPQAPKEPRLRKGLTAEVVAEKQLSLQVPAVPDGWIGMSEICKKANEAEIKTSRIVTAMGGDRALSEPWDPIFQVVYLGGRKYGSPQILENGFALLKDPEYHKIERKGRPKKEKLDEADNPVPKPEKKVKVKVAAKATDPNPWNAKE